MSNWNVVGAAQTLFPSLSATAGVTGRVINANWMSSLTYYDAGNAGYFIKVYRSRGRGLRAFFGRSRVRAEWENLQLFESIGVPTAQLVAWGESTGRDYLGALVTTEVRGTRDLAALVDERTELLDDRCWRRAVISRLADVVQTLHHHEFVHNDLKWRNILVETAGRSGVYLIDCPLGRRMFGPFLKRGRVKDLACLDKVAKNVLSRTDRLRFYLQYKGRPRLASSDKSELRRILTFFSGRD